MPLVFKPWCRSTGRFWYVVYVQSHLLPICGVICTTALVITGMLTAPYTSWSRLYVLTIQEDTFSLTWNWVIVQHAIYKSVSRHLSEQLWYLAGVRTVGLASGAWGWINNLWYTPELHAQDFMQPQPGVQGPMLSLSSGTQNTLQLHTSAVA